MNHDASDTFPEDEQTRWQETLAEDVFLPTVRVQLGWNDVEAAVAQGAIVPQQAHALWANWAMPGSPTRLSSAASEAPPAAERVQESIPSTLESHWPERRPMPQVNRPSRLPGLIGFLVGAVATLAVVVMYQGFSGA
jgi:hypothetical protein